ncbi:MAG: transposase [Rickettsia endosymbiont of Haemaphysalis japonica]
MYHIKYKDRKELAADLKPIYTASTEEEAHLALESFEVKWSKQYPQIAKSWYVHWENLMVFLGYPEAIRKALHRRMKRLY